MFAVPANPVPRTLLTDEEVRHLYGKQRCLNKLFDNPRVAHPAIHQTVVFIFDSLSSIIALNKLPHTKENRQQVECGFKSMQYLEDLIIRIVVRGEDPAVIHEGHLRHWEAEMCKLSSPI